MLLLCWSPSDSCSWLPGQLQPLDQGWMTPTSLAASPAFPRWTTCQDRPGLSCFSRVSWETFSPWKTRTTGLPTTMYSSPKTPSGLSPLVLYELRMVLSFSSYKTQPTSHPLGRQVGTVSKGGLQPAALASPGTLSEMGLLGPHPRPTDSEICVMTSPPGIPMYLKGENQCPRNPP